MVENNFSDFFETQLTNFRAVYTVLKQDIVHDQRFGEGGQNHLEPRETTPVEPCITFRPDLPSRSSMLGQVGHNSPSLTHKSEMCELLR